MKKMVCEICGSKKIKKENDVFICQECGTEYSLEEARKLLKEVDGEASSDINIVKVAKEQNTDVSGKDKLITLLYYWALNLSKIPDIRFWFDSDDSLLSSDEFWSGDLKLKKSFPKINYEYVLYGTLSMENDDRFEDLTPEEKKRRRVIAKRFYNSDYLDQVLENNMKQSSIYNTIKDFIETYGNRYCFILSYSDGSGKFDYSLKRSFGKDNVSNNLIASVAREYELFFIKQPSLRGRLVLYDKSHLRAPSSIQNSFMDILKNHLM